MIFPSQGSIRGGTMLTISGQFFDQTDFPIRVLVGGISHVFLIYYLFTTNSACSLIIRNTNNSLFSTHAFNWNLSIFTQLFGSGV